MKFSIIIPHFNRPDLIMKTIKSFNNLNDKEVIIVDDVSTKENIQKLENNLNLINELQNIKLIKSKNKILLSGARNLGLKHATGEWIFFIDDDDEATPGFIEWLNKDKLNKKYDFYRFPNIERINNKNKKFIFKWWHKKYSPQISTYLFKNNFLKKNNLFFNEKILYGEDTYFQMELFNFKKTKSKYIHHFSFYYNSFEDVETMMRSKKQNVSIHLSLIDEILNSQYKDKKSFALTYLTIYYQFAYRKNKYEFKLNALKVYKEYLKKISPSLKDWIKININWKWMLLLLKLEIFFKKKKLLF